MNGNILLSEKHGVNPSLGVCFWCGQDDGTVLLVGRLPEDREAPRHLCASYEPCAACKEKMALGITIIEADTRPAYDRQPEMQRDVYPTGRWWVLSEEWARRTLQPAEMLDSVLKYRKAFMEREVCEVLFALVTDSDGGAS